MAKELLKECGLEKVEEKELLIELLVAIDKDSDELEKMLLLERLLAWSPWRL